MNTKDEAGSKLPEKRISTQRMRQERGGSEGELPNQPLSTHQMCREKGKFGNRRSDQPLLTQQVSQDKDNDSENIRKEALKRLEEALNNEKEPPEELLWETLKLFSGESFRTAKKLEFFYVIKGNEMFISRKEKSVTRATVMIAFRKALELGRIVTGPKKLRCFGASYLYPVFIRIGVILTTEEKKVTK